MQHCYGCHNISRKFSKDLWRINLIHGVISLPGATPYENSIIKACLGSALGISEKLKMGQAGCFWEKQ